MRGAIPPLPIRLQGVVLSIKKDRDNFTFTLTFMIRTGSPHSWNLKVHYGVHKKPPMDPTLSQTNPVHNPI
jgi:hypothetical protein